ncbi:MAG: phenylalanine--tRNA ligase subunit beta [Patescibacteria group bacterium]|nr:phenylalanine--tRNA ligase subunit beta [Patescibacteria group bacterium]
MKYSYNWLKELSKTKKSVSELTELVMLKGFELEEVEELKKRFDKFVVGEIISVGVHPNADKLRLAQVDVGGREVSVVCGAPNIEAGQKVPVALVGAILPNSKIEIKESEIRGEKSEGMLCAEDELGIGKDHQGILILDNKLKTGTSLAEAIESDDTMNDFDILPNRAHDCLSHQGMAREIAVMEDRKFKIQESKIKITDQKSKLLSIEIKDKNLCQRYMGAVLENIEVKKSPRWMQNALIACGMEPINNVVDITNYVMLEIGNPLHAFDADVIKNGDKNEIVVRRASNGEKLQLLDDSELELNENDLVIANHEGSLALAGIKGGKDSGISEEAKTIVLEAANFNSFSIRKSRQRHCLVTEAQARFEKSITPILAEKGLQRAIELFIEHAGAKLVGVIDENYFEQKDNVVTLELTKVNKLLGKKVDTEQSRKILENLGFEIISDKSDKWEVKIPYWRLDIEGPEDLMEEIGRISGYEKIESDPIKTIVAPPVKNEKRALEWKAKDIMVALGFSELVSYSFYSHEEVELFGLGRHFELKNCLIPQHSVFRKTLVPGVLEKVALNAKNFDRFSIFEIGKVYEIGEKNKPQEELFMAGSFYDKNISREELFYALKGKLEEFIRKLLGKSIELKQDSSGKALVEINGEEIGWISDFNKKIKKFYSIKSDVFVFELSFTKLFNIHQGLEIKTYTPLRKYPVVERDLAMFVGSKVEVGEVEKLIKKAGDDSLVSCELFDIYNDKDKKQKSLAFHLEFGDDNRTMTGEEVDGIMDSIIKELESAGYEVRKQ